MTASPIVKRISAILSLALIIALIGTGEASAQAERPTDTFYLRPEVGFAGYLGDRSTSFFSFNDAVPYSFGFEGGYQFAGPYSLGLNYQLGNYPGIGAPGGAGLRHSLDFLFRYHFRSTTGPTPYVKVGGQAMLGDVDDADGSTWKAAFGPLAGIGYDLPVTDRLSFFFEGTARAALPDRGVDGADDSGFGGFDLLTSLGAGIKISFKKVVIAPQVLFIGGPGQLETAKAGTFSATVAEDATSPVEYRWEWGDGTSSSGLAATHAYTEPGTYTVRFYATNRGGASTQAMPVTVEQPIQPPRLTSITAAPNTPDTNTPVRFSARVQGDTPISYRWSFGDGGTARTASPVHTFEEAGVYTISLTVSNEAGSATETLRLRVEPYDDPSCPEVRELRPVLFGRNSSIVPPEGMQAAQENARILGECPAMQVRIEGWAQPDERNVEALSEDRARALRDYYRSIGIPTGRMSIVGRGPWSNVTGMNGGGLRADTVPVR